MDINRPSVFVGSSQESLVVVEAIQVVLESVCEVVPWTALFDPSEFTLRALEMKLPRFDFGIVVFTADDITISRDELYPSPRDNLSLELGMIIGYLGIQRSLVLCERAESLKIPSDLDGLSLLRFARPRNGNFESAVGSAASRIKKRIGELGCRQDSLSEV